jgi:hypothetical protein
MATMGMKLNFATQLLYLFASRGQGFDRLLSLANSTE